MKALLMVGILFVGLCSNAQSIIVNFNSPTGDSILLADGDSAGALYLYFGTSEADAMTEYGLQIFGSQGSWVWMNENTGQEGDITPTSQTDSSMTFDLSPLGISSGGQSLYGIETDGGEYFSSDTGIVANLDLTLNDVGFSNPTPLTFTAVPEPCPMDFMALAGFLFLGLRLRKFNSC